MPTRDPIESALDAIAAYLTTALAAVSPTISVRKGWPDQGNAFQALSESSAVITITPVDHTETPCSPRDVDRDGSTVTYRVGYLSIRARLELWTAYRAQREDVGPSVQSALHNMLPMTTGLWIASTNYYGRPLSIVPSAGRFMDESTDPTAIGEWRRAWDLEIETDTVAVATVPVLSEVELEVEIDSDAANAETITIDLE
jgi:hypothetical protein